MHSSRAIISFLFTTALAHMHLNSPPPFNATNNPHRTDQADPELDYPYDCCGKQIPYPCRGDLSLLGTPQGASVASWPAGTTQNFSLTGTGNHYGGSRQVGFSIDNGTTFHVATSFQGNCPHRNGGVDPSSQTFNFTVPADMPVGDAVFAWTWFNREQEFNMNCAAISITPSPSSPALPNNQNSTYARALSYHHPHSHPNLLPKRQAFNSSNSSSIPFSQRPGFLIADTGNGCQTPKTTAEVAYPNPGPDVVQGDGAYPLELPGPASACGY